MYQIEGEMDQNEDKITFRFWRKISNLNKIKGKMDQNQATINQNQGKMDFKLNK